MIDAAVAVPAVAAATGRFAAMLAGADPGLQVPTCPGWTVRDLVTHLGNVHMWAEQIVRANDPNTAEERPGEDLAGWYTERARRLCRTLAEVDPARETWNFVGVNTVARFWPRRQLHETTMHTVDLEIALGTIPVIDPRIAADGIAETFEVFAPRMSQRGAGADLRAPVRLEATDAGESWTLLPVEGAAPVLIEDAGATDAVVGTIRGPAGDLLTTLWKRTPPDRLDLTGDRAVLEALLSSRLTA